MVFDPHYFDDVSPRERRNAQQLEESHLEEERRREEDACKHAEQRSVEREERKVDGERLYEIYYAHAGEYDPNGWDDLGEIEKAAWQAFAATLTIDHGLVDNA